MKKIVILAFAALFCHAALAQTRVTGTVTSSEDGTPVSFATIVVKGNNSLTISTDIDGKFTFANLPGNAVLVVSYIGFTTQEVPVNNRTTLAIELLPNALALDEVMVVAYGTVKKASYTGSAAVVKQDVIKDIPVTSFENALTGKVAGMQVTMNSGQAGSTPDIRIRGIGSMNASNEPLYVVDGVPVIRGSQNNLGIYVSSNVMATINPADIESITVLKDAAASSLYGSRAANGVVLIQTKRGKAGTTQISFRASMGVTPSFATYNMDPAPPEKQIEMYYEMFWNAGKQQYNENDQRASARALQQLNNRFNRHGYEFSAPDNTVKSLTVKPITEVTSAHLTMGGFLGKPAEVRADAKGNPIYYNWRDVMFRTAVYQSYDLAVSGGTERSRYYTSLSYTKDQGRSVINDFDRITGRVNLNNKVGKYFEFESNINIAHTNQSGFNDTYSNGSNYFLQAINLLWPMYWPTNFATGDPWTARYSSYAYNPIYYNKAWENSTKNLRVTASEAMSIKFTDDLVFKTLFSFDNTDVRDHLYYSALHWNGSSTTGSVDESYQNIRKMVSSSTLNYNKVFGQKHSLGLLAGWEAEKHDYDFTRASGTNLPTASLHTVATAGTYTANAYTQGYTMLSFLSRAEYNYDSKYYVSGSFRRDASSRLGPNARWGNFWSVGGAWRINKESFLQVVPEISNLRLVGSYGVNGTLPSGNFSWRSLTSYSSAYRYQGQPGGSISTYADVNLSWETNYNTNIALEVGLFQNRISASVGYYNRDSKNLLQSVPISRVTGFLSTLRNIGKINNHGLEIELNGDIIRNKDLTWNVGISASTLKSKVVKLYGGQDIIWMEPIDSNARFIYREGESTLALYGREWAGVERETGKNVWFLNNDAIKPDVTIKGRPATYDWTKAEQIIIGDNNPKLYGGITSGLSWKGLRLDLGFMYKIGTSYSRALYHVNDDGYFWERIQSQWAYDNRWTPEHKDARFPQRVAIDMEDVSVQGSRHLHNGNFIRLKQTTLSYNLPKQVTGKVGLTGARVYFNGVNLWTLAAYKEYDPEVTNLGLRAYEMPLGKTYTFGIELNF